MVTPRPGTADGSGGDTAQTPAPTSASQDPLYLRRPGAVPRNAATGEPAPARSSAASPSDQPAPSVPEPKPAPGGAAAPADQAGQATPTKATSDDRGKEGRPQEAKDSASRKDRRAKAGKPDKADPQAGSAKKSEGKQKPAKGKGKGAASAKAKAGKPSVDGDGLEAIVELTALPAIESDVPSLARASIRPFDHGESFRPAEPPPFRAERTGGKPEPRKPEREKAVALFREAMAQAAKLHAAFLAAAHDATASVEATESGLASQAEADLDRGLNTLRAGLERALLELDMGADAADNLVEQRRSQSYLAITRAANSATGALNALKAEADETFKGHDGERTTKGEDADKAKSGVTGAGGAAASAVSGLDASKEKDHPTNIDPMPSAINEAIDMRLPKRSKERAQTYTEERDAQETHLSKVFADMKDALEKQFKALGKAMDETAKNSAGSIGRARDAARGQLAKGARQMHGSVAQARARGHAALIGQHNTLRRQMIASHRDRSLRENALAQQRAARGGGAALEAAKGQQAGASSLGEALGKEVSRPADDFAKVMSASAGGLLRQLDKAGPQQRDRLARSLAAGENDARAQSQSLGRRLDSSAEEAAGQLEVAARNSGESVGEQARTGTAPFDEIPGQVRSAFASTYPTTKKAYAAQNEGTEAQPGAGQLIVSAEKTIQDTLAGIGGGKSDGSTPAPAATDAKAKGPKEKPAEFQTRAKGIADKPNSDDGIAGLISTAKGDIPPRIENKVGPLHDALMATSTNVESVMVQLRGLTKQQGRALSASYSEKEGGRNLAADLRSELNKFFSDDYTNQQNIKAALAYLAGNTVEAADAELKAAVYLWNDTGRAEKVVRALTPEQLDKLKQEHGDTVADVSGDLDDSEKKIFDKLKEIKPVENLQGQALLDQQAANYKLLGEANSFALKRDIDQALEAKGEAGGDKAADTVATAYQSAGSDALSGGDGAYEDPAAAEARRKAIWTETESSFEKAAPTLPDGSPNIAAADGPKLGAIARYAAAARERTEFVPDDGPDGGHFEYVKKGLDPRQARLIDDIAKTGPNSEDTAASTIEFETNRKEGKPREDRLRKALLGEDLMGAREGESDEDRAKRLADKKDDKGKVVEKGDLTKTKERKAAILQKVAERRAEGKKGPDGQPAKVQTAAEVQKEITGDLDTRFAGDPSGAAYTKSMIESDTLEPDPEKAFDFALAHDERNKETLKATTERMNRDQIKAAVAKWDEGKPENDRLYARLGMYGHKGKLEGDARNEVEISFRGKPRNDKEKALIAVMVVEQQRRDSAAAGRALAKGEYDRMTGEQAKVLGYLGVKRGDIDEQGDIRVAGPDGTPIKGKFNDKGQLELNEAQRGDFESAMRFSHMHAESYKQAVDRISQGIVMALVVAAAVITTFVTFGGAAAIWGPILITAAAGFAGMAMTAAIRGDRYTKAEMQRDFVMTLVQAATAGLGAGLGAAAKGAGTAAKGAAALEKGAATAAEAAATGEKLAAGAAGLAGKETVTFGAKALQFGKDVVIGGGTNAVNSFAAAAMDPENRRQGKALDKGMEGGLKGFLSGSLGAALNKPMSALGKPFGKLGERIGGNVGGGFATRLADARIGQAMGDPHQSWAESIEGAKEGIAQDVIQATGEHYAESAAEHRAQRKEAARTRAAAPGEEPHARPAARPQAEEPRAGPGPKPSADAPAATQPEAQRPAAPQAPRENLPEEGGRARAAAVQEALPPEVRPIAEAAGAPKRSDLDAAAHRMAEEPPRLPAPANDNEPAVPSKQRAVGELEEGGAPRHKEGTNEPVARPEDQELRQRTHGDDPEKTGEYPAYKPKTLEEHFADPDPRPAPIFVTADLTPELLKGKPSIPGHSEITASNPHSEAAALANYHALRLADPHREVSIIRCVDPQSESFGEYRVFQGGAESVSRPPDGWVSDRHAHPILGEGGTSQRLARSLPTGSGGDFAVMHRELEVLSGLVQTKEGVRRDSIIDVRLGDKHVETHFSITRNGDQYEYHVTFRPPHDGVDHMGPFYSITDYEKAATKLSGVDFSQRSENDSYRTAGVNVTAEPPRVVHGEPVTASMRQDIEFIQQRMALAGEFEGQIKGTAARGELDPSLGRAATLNDAHARVTRMGLVGEPDSMIRLHNILNDEAIPVPVRALISDTTLAATREHLLRTGQLAPGEQLVMLFHGATPERTQSLVKDGIDMARGPGGPADDFGEGLYFTKSLETALEYRNRRSGALPGDEPGAVIPYLVRGRELGNSVDVSSKGNLRAQWEAFAVANAKTLFHDTYASPTLRKVLMGEPISFSDFGHFDRGRQGQLFNDFLASIGARPSVIFGDLGGPLTHGIQLKEVTDQVVIRDQKIADVMNEQHVRAGTRDADAPLGGGDDVQLRTVGTNGLALAPIEHLDNQQLKNRVDNAFDAMAPGPQPRRPEDWPQGVSLKDSAAAAAEQTRRDALVAHVVAEVSARRGPDAAAHLTELLIIGGEPMARALRSETEEGMGRALGALPETLAKPLSLSPNQRSQLIELMLDRAARDAPNQPQQLRESRVRRQVERWEKNGLSRGDIDRFAGVALDLRGEGKQGFATPARQAANAEDFKLRNTVDAALEGHTETIWGIASLRGILNTTDEGWLLRFAHEGMLPRGNELPPLVERWYGYLDSIKPPATVSAEGFEKFARGHMKRVERPAFSELEAAFALGGRKPHQVFSTDPVLDSRLELVKCAIDPETGLNNPTAPGTDLIGYRRSDDKIVVGDDKAWTKSADNQGLVDEVSAYFASKERVKENPRAGLIQNLADDATAIRTNFDRQQARGQAVDPKHLAMPDRLEAASKALEKAFPKGLVLTDRTAPKVRKILREHGIELVVTSLAGRGMTGVSKRLQKAGTVFLRNPIVFPEPDDEDK